ncbi:MAG: SLBB domain-containing protein, partial [Pseudomonadota bacterium]|nr:SLBB domain-containing protein [Pseudomonadota bacterium]
MKKKTTLAIVYSLVGLAALCMQFTLYAQTPTPEQLRQFGQLTPAQRTALMRELGESSAVQQQQRQPELTVITPRPAPTESFESTEPVAGEGLEGLAVTKEPESASPLLKRFGYDLFAGEPTTFAPAADIPIPVDYIVGPGDTIELQLFGSQNAFYSLVVTREGVLNFPELGPITVSGLRFSDLRVTLQERVSEQMIGVRASITMGRLRSIRIFILGDAYRPGSYTISSLSTMTNGLLVSGGINPIGSLRNVQLKRNGRLIQTLDLYDLLLRGDTSADTRLQPGDVIFIPPVGRTVGVDGEVRRPAIYELRAEKTVDDVLELAGGLLPTAYPQASQIERINDKRE